MSFSVSSVSFPVFEGTGNYGRRGHCGCRVTKSLGSRQYCHTTDYRVMQLCDAVIFKKTSLITFTLLENFKGYTILILLHSPVMLGLHFSLRFLDHTV